MLSLLYGFKQKKSFSNIYKIEIKDKYVGPILSFKDSE